MNITIDGALREMPPGQHKTLGDVYSQLVATAADSGRAVAAIEIDGKAIPAGRIWDLTSQPIAELRTLELTTRDTREMVKEMMASTRDHVSLLISETEKAATMFRVGNELSAQERFAKCASGLQWFLKALDALRGFLELDYAAMPMDQTSVGANFEELIPVVDRVLDAQAEGDSIQLADLMEYELVPKMRKWLDFLPELEEKALAFCQHSNEAV